jgi:hypothetical protein
MYYICVCVYDIYATLNIYYIKNIILYINILVNSKEKKIHRLKVCIHTYIYTYIHIYTYMYMHIHIYTSRGLSVFVI